MPGRASDELGLLIREDDESQPPHTVRRRRATDGDGVHPAAVLRDGGAVVVRDSSGRLAYPDVGALLAAGDEALGLARRALEARGFRP